MARAMSLADGYDPDELVPAPEAPRAAPDQEPRTRGSMPRWRAYAPRAAALIAAQTDLIARS